MLHQSPWQHQASAAMCYITTLFSIRSDTLPPKLALWLISSLDLFSSANSSNPLIARMNVRPALTDLEK